MDVNPYRDAVSPEQFFVMVYVISGLSIALAYMTRRPYVSDVAVTTLALTMFFAVVIAFGLTVAPDM